MSIAREAALRIQKRYRLARPIQETDLDRVLHTLGFRVVEIPVSLPVLEFTWGHTIGIRADQSPRSRLWLKAHALGHCLLHVGDQTTLDNWWLRHQERQAEEFAGWLLIGHIKVAAEPWDLADYYDVPQERVQYWLQLVETW